MQNDPRGTKACIYWKDRSESVEVDLDRSQKLLECTINDLQEEFEENDSELETGARDSIGETVEYILKWFQIDLDVEDAIQERDW